MRRTAVRATTRRTATPSRPNTQNETCRDTLGCAACVTVTKTKSSQLPTVSRWKTPASSSAVE